MPCPDRSCALIRYRVHGQRWQKMDGRANQSWAFSDFILLVWVTRTCRLPNVLSSLSKSCARLMCSFICSEELEPRSRTLVSLPSSSPPALPLRPISVATLMSMLVWLVWQPPGGFTFLHVYMLLLKTTNPEQLTLRYAWSALFLVFFSQVALQCGR